MRHLILSGLVLAGTAFAAEQAATTAPIIAAERAFAADAGARGWVPAFQASVAPDAVELDPDPVDAAAKLAATPDDHFTGLDWRPAFAGIARSGDLGFTTGPYFVRGHDGVRGHYFTVWRKQSDGAWKWIFDGGVAVMDASPIAREASPQLLGIADRGAGSQEGAIEQVRLIEGLQSANPTAHVQWETWLAANAHVDRAGAPPAVGAAAVAAFRGDGNVAFSFQRAEASIAGDLVFTFGEAHWRTENAGKRGYYARIWQCQRDGWRLVFDEIIPREGG
ncbi:MAG: DUF4440 domain-containing protein [Pseudomonadota bacterium]